MTDGQFAWLLYGAIAAVLFGLPLLIGSLRALYASRRARRRAPYDWEQDPTFRQPGHVRVLP